MSEVSPKDTEVAESNETMTPGKTKIAAVYRLILMLLAVLNQFLVMFDLYPAQIADNNVIMLISVVLTVITSCYAYWKNNSWTPEAKTADKVLESLRNGDVSISDILDILSDLSRKH